MLKLGSAVENEDCRYVKKKLLPANKRHLHGRSPLCLALGRAALRLPDAALRLSTPQ